MSKKVAIIDLGTNTFNLLIIKLEGENSYEIIFNTKVGVGLGLGGINENKIGKEAFKRGVETLKSYKAKTELYQVEKIYALGTSALRNATNSSDFVKEVERSTGIIIEVISGSDEAELILKGALLGYKVTDPTLIMDIGGGSTEFIFCNEAGLIKAESFEIGVARILQKYNLSDPMSVEDCHQIESYLNTHLNEFFKDIEANCLMGTSGSFETFYAMKYGKEYPENEYVAMEIEEVEQIIDEILKSTLKEREQNKWIIPIRQKMLPIAALKVRCILRKLKNKKIIISPFALKEGMMQRIIEDDVK